MKNLIVRQVSAGENDVLMFLHATRAPNAAEWADAMGLMTRYARTGDFRRLRCLVVSDGGGPDASQRGEIQAFYKSEQHWMKTSVCTASMLTRGIVAAVSWFNPHIKAFAPHQFAGALAHLGLPHSVLPRLVREFTEMERGLSPNSCLALIARNSVAASATL